MADKLPQVTISLLVLNVLVFGMTLYFGLAQQQQFQTVLTETLACTRQHPEVTLTEAAAKRLAWLPLTDESSQTTARALLQHRETQKNSDKPDLGPTAEQMEMAVYCGRLVSAYDNFWASKYSFIPRDHRSSLQPYLTAIFLHFGFVHLLLSLLLLWAAGVMIEDLWGSPVFAGVWLVCAVAATFIHALVDPHSNIPAMGASGGSAGLMGAVTVRLLRARVRWSYWIVVSRGRTELPAFVLPVIWVVQVFALELLSRIYPVRTGFNLAAHFGTFALGAGLALLLAQLKLEKYYVSLRDASHAEQSGDSREIRSALETFEQGETKAALQKIHDYMLDRPEDLGALNALLQIYQRLGQRNLIASTWHRIIDVHLKSNDRQNALDEYRAMLATYAEGELPPPVAAREWTILCDYLLELKESDEATSEYEKLGRAHPEHSLAVRAFIVAAEIQLDHKQDKARAQELFQCAASLRPTNPMWQKRVISGLAKIEKAQAAVRRR